MWLPAFSISFNAQVVPAYFQHLSCSCLFPKYYAQVIPAYFQNVTLELFLPISKMQHSKLFLPLSEMQPPRHSCLLQNVATATRIDGGVHGDEDGYRRAREEINVVAAGQTGLQEVKHDLEPNRRPKRLRHNYVGP